jgi:dynactin complex subunit
MTWIAACSGQRGIYQEVIMTDEKRQKLVARLRAHEVVMWTDIDLAADEIERLAKELANANRLLEINRRRSLEKSGGLEIKQSELETAADLLEQLAHELVATNERLEQLEARLEALERM